jgi:hypothetical protein
LHIVISHKGKYSGLDKRKAGGITEFLKSMANTWQLALADLAWLEITANQG